MTIEFAKSLSGHDRNHIYYILEKEDRAAYLVNGSTHQIANPKKKNVKHFQIIKDIPKEVQDLLKREEELSNLIIRRAIREYEKISSKKEK
ncbi:MAG: KOW domain-containing protein [Roseburia sp.]|nr:KOW domain-containing protein [Roseburia sp.]